MARHGADPEPVPDPPALPAPPALPLLPLPPPLPPALLAAPLPPPPLLPPLPEGRMEASTTRFRASAQADSSRIHTALLASLWALIVRTKLPQSISK